MQYLLPIYFLLATVALAALSWMIFKIGNALADCPQTGRAARAGAMTITAGFIAMGAGGVLIIAAIAFLAEPAIQMSTLLGALGLSILCLGLGFSQAIATLRDVVAQAAKQAAKAAKA